MTDTLPTGNLQEKLAALNRLVEISLRLNSRLQLDPLLNDIMAAATEITGGEAASILLMDRNTQELVITAATGDPGSALVGTVVPLDGSIAGAIVTEDEALIIDDVEKDPRHYPKVDEEFGFVTRSILGLPMRIKDRLVGVLEVLNKQDGSFNEDDLRHITILAAQAAVAIENARLVESLEAANEDLSRVNELKNSFIAVASRELRTPMGVILSYATYLQETAEEENREYIEELFKNALKMLGLIEGLTNLRYVQLEQREMDITTADLGAVLRKVYDETLKLAEAKGQTYQLHLPDEPLMARIDKSKVQMALANVVNNAIKFTPTGGEITVDTRERSSEIWVRVHDSGIGIPADQTERIFEQFVQVEDFTTRKKEGLGLGLTIARAVMERIGGRIWAESPGKGEGSTFTLAFQRAGDGPSFD